MAKAIRKLLIANRGEIAVRVIETCQKLSIRTVAVYSDADRDALHVKLADEAIHIGAAAATDSYLVAEKIITAAKRTGADAIHPGYGFLSENPDFAENCAQNDIIFIGPSAASMNAMALKGAAKKLMTEAGVPVVPGYHGDDQSTDILIQEANNIGFPVLIKAVAGGGGKGMRKVFNQDDLPAAIESARREGENSFGNGKLLIEKYIEKPRHIEVQVFGDSDGHAVYLWERDCSLQRRHQKVVEEAPAPGMTTEMRRQMGQAAVKAAESISYTGAGTVEFIVDVANGLQDAPFYFMEMNTRLQVEHPVTELITGQDLVEWQIKIAEGSPLPHSQDEIDLMVTGHALEVRLYAEDANKNFMPSTGKVGLFDPYAALPSGGRIDAGVMAGDTVTVHYDPMIAKLIAYGDNRDHAIDVLKQVIAESPVSNLITNRDFLLRAITHPEFVQADLDTAFIERNEADLFVQAALTPETIATASLVILASREERKQAHGALSPWEQLDGFQLNLPYKEHLDFDIETEDGQQTQIVTVEKP